MQARGDSECDTRDIHYTTVIHAFLPTVNRDNNRGVPPHHEGAWPSTGVEAPSVPETVNYELIKRMLVEYHSSPPRRRTTEVPWYPLRNDEVITKCTLHPPMDNEGRRLTGFYVEACK